MAASQGLNTVRVKGQCGEHQRSHHCQPKVEHSEKGKLDTPFEIYSC